jgi:hypothetical protein
MPLTLSIYDAVCAVVRLQVESLHQTLQVDNHDCVSPTYNVITKAASIVL